MRHHFFLPDIETKSLTLMDQYCLVLLRYFFRVLIGQGNISSRSSTKSWRDGMVNSSFIASATEGLWVLATHSSRKLKAYDLHHLKESDSIWKPRQADFWPNFFFFFFFFFRNFIASYFSFYAGEISMGTFFFFRKLIELLQRTMKKIKLDMRCLDKSLQAWLCFDGVLNVLWRWKG